MFGPFEGRDLSEMLEKLSEMHDRERQSVESGTHRLRVLVEGMSDELLDDLGWLFQLASDHPEMIHIVRGVLTAEWWKRNPIKPEDVV